VRGHKSGLRPRALYENSCILSRNHKLPASYGVGGVIPKMEALGQTMFMVRVT
jgi:hypothetical protein